MLGKGVFIVGAKRTPFGSFGGALLNHSANDLALLSARAALKDAKLDPQCVDHIVFGNSLQSSKDAVYLARHTGLKAEIPKRIPALIVNRLCGSGFQAVIEATMQILCGVSKVVLAGGAESMSQAPFGVRNARFGIPLFSDLKFEDFLSASSLDTHCNLHMGETAEALGKQYGITREAADEYAHRSQQRWQLAHNFGLFELEIEPIMIKSKHKEEMLDRDEHPRETSIETLANLKPIFQKNGLVTPGNASGVSDGAAAVIVAVEDSVSKLHLTPMARIVDWSVVGCDPTIMGYGPVDAIRDITTRTGIRLADIDIVEINEAFAAQVLAVQKELGDLDSDRLNINSGAIAMGHPLGASGARIVGHMARELQRRKVKYALGAACVGGGQGIAVLLEHV